MKQESNGEGNILFYVVSSQFLMKQESNGEGAESPIDLDSNLSIRYDKKLKPKPT